MSGVTPAAGAAIARAMILNGEQPGFLRKLVPARALQSATGIRRSVWSAIPVSMVGRWHWSGLVRYPEEALSNPVYRYATCISQWSQS